MESKLNLFNYQCLFYHICGRRKKVQRNVEGRKKNHHKQDRVDWQLGEFPSLFFVVVACAYDFGFLS